MREGGEIIRDEFVLRSLHRGVRFAVDVHFKREGAGKPLVIFVHGFKGFKDWGPFNVMAKRFVQEGFVFLKLNLSHNGTTVERPEDFVDLEAFAQNNFSIELDDLTVLIEHLFSSKERSFAKECDLKKIYLLGHSRGGSIAILKACEDKRISALSSWAAVSDYTLLWSLKEIERWKKKGVIYILSSRTGQRMPLYYQMCEDFYKNRRRLDISKAICSLTVPLFLAHAKDDLSVPVRMACDLKKWYKRSELLLLEEGGHALGAKHPYEENFLPVPLDRVVQETIRFFKNAG